MVDIERKSIRCRVYGKHVQASGEDIYMST